MKAVRMILFCFACLMVFLVVGAATCTIRAKYRYVPNVRANLAYSYAAFFSDYALLQSNQAGGDQGKTALLQYLGILQRFQNEKIKYPEKILHLYSELTYLRLYQLEVDTNNPVKADQYLKSAENELAILGHREITPEKLIKYIQAKEAYEAKLYNSKGDTLAQGSH
jgi:hypothetical protein